MSSPNWHWIPIDSVAKDHRIVPSTTNGIQASCTQESSEIARDLVASLVAWFLQINLTRWVVSMILQCMSWSSLKIGCHGSVCRPRLSINTNDSCYLNRLPPHQGHYFPAIAKLTSWACETISQKSCTIPELQRLHLPQGTQQISSAAYWRGDFTHPWEHEAVPDCPDNGCRLLDPLPKFWSQRRWGEIWLVSMQVTTHTFPSTFHKFTIRYDFSGALEGHADSIPRCQQHFSLANKGNMCSPPTF